jgi:cell division protein FtsI (penicillin-binding protein 3)
MAYRSSRQPGAGGQRPRNSRRQTDQNSTASRQQRRQSAQASSADVFSGRLLVVLGIFMAIAVILLGRLLWLTVIDAQNNLDRGNSRDVTVTVSAKRGTIYDRNGTILATTVDAYNVFCHPHMVDSADAEKLANALAEAFGGEAKDYKEKITSDTNFVYLYKGADEAGMKKIKELNIEGVDFEKTTKREYPCGSVGSQIIGILNSDGKALTGLELYYDDILAGTDGEKTTEYSKEGVPVPGSETVTAEVVDGKDIVLSIDIDMQEQLEESLAVRVEEVQGSGGSAILMDSATGEIYACSSSPTFDITNTKDIKEGATNLSGISSAFEPGSVIKPLTMLAALSDGKVSANSTIYCPNKLTVDGYTITDSHSRESEDMSMADIIAESSNVGISLVAQELGFSRLAEYIQRYQLCLKTGVDYPGEASGSIAKRDSWSSVQGCNISFGQGLTTTPIEMVRFYAALANDGVAVTPHFLVSVPSEGAARTYETTRITDRVDCITELEGMMQQVVERGTGTDAQIDGYRVVGKTGTAEIASDSGGYKQGEYNLSFVGYMPDASTNLVCFVGATDVPGERKTVPAFKDIMSFAIDRYNITQK